MSTTTSVVLHKSGESLREPADVDKTLPPPRNAGTEHRVIGVSGAHTTVIHHPPPGQQAIPEGFRVEAGDDDNDDEPRTSRRREKRLNRAERARRPVVTVITAPAMPAEGGRGEFTTVGGSPNTTVIHHPRSPEQFRADQLQRLDELELERDKIRDSLDRAARATNPPPPPSDHTHDDDRGDHDR